MTQKSACRLTMEPFLTFHSPQIVEFMSLVIVWRAILGYSCVMLALMIF